MLVSGLVGSVARLAVPSLVGMPIEALVTGFGGGVVRMETDDPRILRLDGSSVLAECATRDELVRLQGRLEVLVHLAPPFVTALVARDEPLRIQRRRWRRVRVRVPVRLVRQSRDPSAVAGVLTETLDLSAGGMLVRDGGGIGTGELVAIELDLPSGRVRLPGRVLEVRPDGPARIRFEGLPEGTVKRLVRYVFTVELASLSRRPPPRA